MKILASFDPGVTTGCALFDMDDPENPLVFSCLSMELVELWDLLENSTPSVIVFEVFRLFQKNAFSLIGSSFPVTERIGVIKLWAYLNQVPTVEQTPSIAKSAVPDFILQRLGIKTKNPHQNDAIRHGIYYLNRSKKIAIYNRENSAGSM